MEILNAKANVMQKQKSAGKISTNSNQPPVTLANTNTNTKKVFVTNELKNDSATLSNKNMTSTLFGKGM